MSTTTVITGALFILLVWVVVIWTCVAVSRRRNRRLGPNNTTAAQNRRNMYDVEAGRGRPITATRQQPKNVDRDFSPVPAYHRRESFGSPTVPAAVYAAAATAGASSDLPPAYSAAAPGNDRPQ